MKEGVWMQATRGRAGQVEEGRSCRGHHRTGFLRLVRAQVVDRVPEVLRVVVHKRLAGVRTKKGSDSTG